MNKKFDLPDLPQRRVHGSEAGLKRKVAIKPVQLRASKEISIKKAAYTNVAMLPETIATQTPSAQKG